VRAAPDSVASEKLAAPAVQAPDGKFPGAPSPRYARYVLAVLTLVYVLNFLDRQIITILAEEIKRDLGVSDSEIGFLYGTAFAVFYAVFGIPLGRLGDVWSRRSLIAAGLATWSMMTALSGLARSFGQLAAARVGVGIGEASATPAAFSMLSDSFPAWARATVLALYSSGIYIGAGLGLFIGGQIVERWNAVYAGGGAPAGLAGWQVAYLAVGLPGLLLALWVRTLREPLRGAADGIHTPEEPHPFRQSLLELRSVLPPLTLFHLWRVGAGTRGVLVNLLAAAALAAGAGLLIAWTGSTLQWIAMAIGLYASVSWVQGLALRDRPGASLILGSPALRWSCLGFSFLAFTGYSIGGWTPVFFMRVHGASSGEVGTIVGLTSAVAGFVGVTLGGALADRLRRRSRSGRLHVGLLTAALPVLPALWMLTTESATLAYVLNFPVSVGTSMWIGAGASTVQDLVLPRMRGLASAFYILIITFVGLALGPYTIGQLSDSLGDLALAMRLGLLANVAAAVLLLAASRHLTRDEATLLARARAAGEPGLDEAGSGA
jgi:MFS family permease